MPYNNYEFIFILTSILVVILLSEKSKYIGYKIKLIDYPNKIGIHKNPTSIIGGIILYLFTSCFILLFQYDLTALVWITLFFLVGLIDDYTQLSYKKKIFLILSFTSIFITYDDNLLINKIITEFGTFNLQAEKWYLLNFIITVLSIFVLINAINMMDGHNGICIYAFILYFFFIIFNNQLSQNLENFLFAIILILIILYIYNVNNHLFLGNSGNFILTGIISYYLIKINNTLDSNLRSDQLFLILMFPGLDMTRLFIERLIKNKNPFKGDLNHLHHLLNNRLKSTNNTTLTYCSILSIPFLFLISPIMLIDNIVPILIFLNILFYTAIIIWVKKLI